jgi:hypothetical protein
MLTFNAGVRVHLALGVTDMRRGFDGWRRRFRQCCKLIHSRVICSFFVADGVTF